MQSYPTDLTDDQWQVIKEFFNCERKRSYDLRPVVNALLYAVKTGCQWRMLPYGYPKWQRVYYYFSQWKDRGIIEMIKEALVRTLRTIEGRKEQPTVAIIDAQSVKATLTSPRSTTGYDAGKKVKGIKRQIAVDTLGLPLSEVVHSAGIADRRGGAMLAEKLKIDGWSGIEKLFADGGYSLVGKAEEQPLQELTGYVLEIVKKPESPGFKVLPKRWVVERTFSWIETNRRNAKYYEKQESTAEAMVRLSAIRMMLNRLCPRMDKPVFKPKKPLTNNF